MIVCPWNEIDRYESIIPNLAQAKKAVEELGKTGYPVGRCEFEGGYVLSQEPTTKEFAADKFETHSRYLDIQIILEGQEIMYYQPVANLKEAVPYNPEKDIQFFEGRKEDSVPVYCQAGMCYVVYPEDAHMPSRMVGEPAFEKKLVVKLPL